MPCPKVCAVCQKIKRQSTWSYECSSTDAITERWYLCTLKVVIVKLVPPEPEEDLEWKDFVSHLQELLGTWNFLVVRDFVDSGS
jgi:hypothetical protein